MGYNFFRFVTLFKNDLTVFVTTLKEKKIIYLFLKIQTVKYIKQSDSKVIVIRLNMSDDQRC